MKLRILARETRSGTENIILCSDGFYTAASEENLKYIFSHISRPEMLHGDGDMPWELIYDTMEEYPGKTLAWIDDDCVLHITEDNPFMFLLKEKVEVEAKYLTAEEFAAREGRTPVRVRVLCREGRFPGAIKKGSSWLIPESAVYPADNRFVEEPKRPRKKQKT